MKRIGIREVQINLTTLLNDLPFAITRYGKVIAVVKEEGSFPSLQETANKVQKIQEDKKLITCKHGNIPQLCKYHDCRKT